MRWILTILLFCSLTEAVKVKKQFWFINGGGSRTINYDVHEREAQVFNRVLFGGRGGLLNAGGKGSPVVQLEDDGLMVRNSSGQLVTRPSTLNGYSASKSDVNEMFRNAKNFGVDEMTVVYGDHGTPNGVSLWIDDDLSALDIAKLHSEFPEKTLIRSIHMHCHAASAVVPQHWSVPNSLEELRGYIQQFFGRDNSCALALSDSDEMGQYVDWEKKSGKSQMEQRLDAARPKSLSGLKASFQRSDEYAVAPWLTSDLLARDLRQYICRYLSGNVTNLEREMKRINQRHAEANKKYFRNPDLSNPCRTSDREKEIKELNRERQELDDTFFEMSDFLMENARTVIEANTKHSFRDYDKAMGEIESYKANWVLAGYGFNYLGNDQSKHQAKFDKLLLSKRTPKMLTLEKLLESVTEAYAMTDEMDKFYDKFDINSVRMSHPAVYRYFSKPENRNKNPLEWRNELFQQSTKIQKKMKSKVGLQQFQDKAFVKRVFGGLPLFQGMLGRLNAIEKCENSILN